MTRKLLASAVLAGALFGAAPAMAEELSLHTFLLVWVSDNCEGFEYSEDMLRHANIAVMDAPEAEVAAFTEKMEHGLNDLFEGDKEGYCQSMIRNIEDLEAEAAE